MRPGRRGPERVNLVFARRTPECVNPATSANEQTGVSGAKHHGDFAARGCDDQIELFRCPCRSLSEAAFLGYQANADTDGNGDQENEGQIGPVHLDMRQSFETIDFNSNDSNHHNVKLVRVCKYFL